MPVLDTDTLTIIQRRSEPGFGRLLARFRALPVEQTVWVTIISYEEQLRGWLEYVKRSKPRELSARYANLWSCHHDFSTRLVLQFDGRLLTRTSGCSVRGRALRQRI